ncbi:hypothetical protein [Flavobacterium psychrophilum]|uniref:hypothetical protein n=1 Tax=Flavobacterium psychrophilum TaxID=96345 RepID=UPI000B72401F|nr:hypothetical protein [Flavobacterium psychrophilum]EKT4544246.1 hypothetical protein [Flavobacterium psychrophilum]OUD30970.1 hypothetical protein FPG1W08_04470 [Flavobacterium psychrophilum]
MKTAILGWGSLIWQPKDLAFNKEFGWKKDGPILPIEFARISKDGRLTLVITENKTKVPVLYALSDYQSVEEAILNLAVREGSGRGSIGSYDKTKNEFSHDVFFEQNILDWIKNTEFDAIIWTNLGENWNIKNEKGEIIRVIQPDKRIEYLKELKGNSSVLAEEYIRKTPKQINTKYRSLIEDKLNWKPIEN